MRVHLKRTWQQPVTFKRWRKEGSPYEFPESSLKDLPPDAEIEAPDGTFKAVRAARVAPPAKK